MKNYITEALISKKKSGSKPIAGAQSITPEDLKASSQFIYLLFLNAEIPPYRETYLQISLELLLLSALKFSTELHQQVFQEIAKVDPS
jgi:hypothetical protein